MKLTEFKKLIREEVRKVLKEADLFPYHIAKDSYMLNGKKIYIVALYDTKEDPVEAVQNPTDSVYRKAVSPSQCPHG